MCQRITPAGYDAHWCDPLASMQLTSATYHWLAAEAQALAARHCAGRCLFVLEVRAGRLRAAACL